MSRVKAYQQETQLRTAGGLSDQGHHRRGAGGGHRERDQERHLLRLLAAHDLLGARERVRDGLPRGLRAPAEAARPERQLLRARRLGPAHRERLPGGHGLRQRALALHVDAARPGRRVDPGAATASSASAPGSACSSSSSTASATAAGSSRSSASDAVSNSPALQPRGSTPGSRPPTSTGSSARSPVLGNSLVLQGLVATPA